jgi:hypothetical protein
MYQPNVTICGIVSSSALSAPNSGYAHSETGNLSATDGGGGAGGGAAGGASLLVLAVPLRAVRG